MVSGSSVRFKIVITLSFILISLCSFGQEKVTVIGTVIDAETNLPIPYVNVFFNNTTLGAATDSTGKYRMYNVPIEFRELIASSIGYTTLKVNLNLQPRKILTVDFRMLPDRRMLSTVVIHANRNEEGRTWNKNYKLFKDIFLGSTRNSLQTEIINPNVLSFKAGEKPGDIIATADLPIEVENRSLGYKLFVTLEEFNTSSKSYNMLITTRFDTLTSKGQKERLRWQQNRITTYKGSQRHLFKSIMDGRYLEEEFRIYQRKTDFDISELKSTIVISDVPALISDIYVDTIKRGDAILKKGLYQINYLNKVAPKNQRILPDYPFAVSWIHVKDAFLTLAPNGEPVVPTNFVRAGDMNAHRVADLLPHNFSPVAEETSLALSKKTELLSVIGTVKDENDNLLVGVEVFVNNGLTHTSTNAWGQFVISDLHPGRYPIGFTYGDMKQLLMIIDLAGEDEEISVVLKEKIKHSSFPKRDDQWETYKDLFERKLVQQKEPLVGKFYVTNPYVLHFKKSKKRIDVEASAPLVIENTAMGYQWKYFMDSAYLIRKKGAYRLAINGLVKMDTLKADLKIGFHRWQANRFDEYEGSWNSFTKSLIEGRVEDEGFKTYQLKKSVSKKRPKFKRLIGHDLVSIHPDSLLIGQGEKFYLKVPKGLEIHYNDKTGEQKFYKGFSKQVIRITSDSSQISISPNGVIAPKDLSIAGLKDEFLKRVPVDFKVPYGKITDPNVKVFVKESNLKSIKNLLEKTYIQTDKPYYYPGDTIWLKAYMKYANLNYQDSLSRVLYMDLVDPQNRIIANRILKITESQAWGDFVLATEMPAGNYYLRAYTNWGRNFDEFFTRPIPIILRENFIVSQTIDTTSLVPNGLNVSFQSNKTSFTTRDSVELTLQLSNEQGPASSSFSVSITDQSAVADLNEIPTIESLQSRFKADGSSMIRLKYPVERGVTLYGKIRDAIKDEPYSVAIVLLPDKGSNVIKTKGADFHLTFDIADTVSAIIKCTDQLNSIFTTDMQARDTIGFFIPPEPLIYKLHNNTSYTRTALHFGKNTRVLPEVIIKAKRITPDKPKEKTFTEKRLGMPNKIIEGEAVLDIRKSQNLMTSLTHYIPDFSNTQIAILQTSNKTAYSKHEYSPIRVYEMILDGTSITLEDFNLIPVSSISRIEQYLNVSNGLGGLQNIISIYTDAMFPLVPLYDKYLLRGYDIPLAFKTPDIKSNLPDYRSTLYWNPHIKTDETGNAIISFRTSDVDGVYKVTIEGMTSEGEIFRLIKLLTVIK